MQTIDFEDKLEENLRKPYREVYIDWENDGVFSNETHRLMVVEIDRSIDEPLGSTRSAIADLVLENTNDRYTPTG